eukprot:COSAG03_NODE_16652_length_395_cov_2.097973_2_plen_33_part_01
MPSHGTPESIDTMHGIRSGEPSASVELCVFVLL